MRGKAVNAYVTFLHVGITPAYAGKRGTGEGIALDDRDHPRLCGEKVFRHIALPFLQGSPPPMRGKGVSHSSQTFVSGITPAYAGKSATSGSPPFEY